MQSPTHTRINLRPKHMTCALLLLGMLSCGGPPRSDAPYNRAQAETEIRKIENSWAQVAVSGDPSVIAHIFADDFVGVAPDGVHYTKQGFIDDTKAHPLGFTSTKMVEMKVRFEGNVAVAQGHETFARKDGERGRFVWTDVLVRRDGRWQLIAAQDAMVPDTAQTTGVGLFAGSTPKEQAREGIDKTRNEYVAAWKEANASKIVQLYTETALVMYPNQPALTGRGAIGDYFEGLFAECPKNEFELTSLEIEIAGQWAFDRGTYRWKGVPRAGAEPAEDRGKYLVVLQKQANGEWKVARDMDNSDRPASQSTRGTH